MGSSKRVWVKLVFLLIISELGRSEGCLEQERSALIQITHFFSFPYSLDWAEVRDGQNYSDCCQWQWVECSATTGRVRSLYLLQSVNPKLGKWYMNASLFTPFKQLKFLDLRGNKIMGCVKNEGLERLSKLSNLKSLDLGYNLFNNAILLSLSGLSSLKHLYLDRNRLEGTIDVRGLSKLKFLDLSSNYLMGGTLSSLSALSSLRTLNLSQNGFKGTFDVQELDSLRNLEVLNLHYNEIVNLVVPKGLSKLKILDLSYNNLKCDTLSSLSVLSSLRELSLYHNGLRGTFDVQELDSLRNLEVLNLGYNEIVNLVVPKDYGGLRKLNLLDLSGVPVTDGSKLLQSIGSFPSLKTLSLVSKNFTETVTTNPEVHNFTNLEELQLEDASLHISVLQSIAAFTSLKRLSMKSCEVNGVLRGQGFLNFKNLEHLEMKEARVALNTSFLQFISESMASLKYLSLFDSILNDATTLDQGICELVHLQELYIIGSDLTGSLPWCMANMTFLQVFAVPSNQLTGSIPSGLCELVHLHELIISGNDIRGSLPWCIANMTSLQVFDVSSNQLTGSISSGLCELVHLQRLSIQVNNISGSLPWCLSNMTSLQLFEMFLNQLSGNISSSSVTFPTSIQELTLSNNHFQIPLSLEPFLNLSKLKRFDGQNNQIYAESESHSSTPKFQLTFISLSGYGNGGTFPKFLYHQHELHYVDLSHINLTGEFPNWLLENNTKLEQLLLANNSLSGSLRLPIHSHKNLNILDISKNHFQYHIPIEIGAYLPSIWFLNISRNAFGGSIPTSFGDMTWLVVFDISYNMLTGEIPEHMIAVCFLLEVLALSNNSLQGHVFSKNFSLTSLSQLQLDGNNFTGEIPEVLSNCHRLNGLYLSDNHFSGKIPRWLGNLSNLEYIIMPNNYIEGPIPTEFCQLTSLKVLDLSNNSISGFLPSCFSPNSIRQVHLSRNKIGGQLKDAFCHNSSLVTLDLSYNRFHGGIPNCIERLSKLKYLLLDNNHIEGEMPIQLCRLKQLRLIDLSYNNISGHIPPCLVDTALGEGNFNDAAAPTSSFVNNDPRNLSMEKPEAIQFTTKNMSYYYHGRILTSMFGIDLSCNKLTGKIPTQIGYLSRIHALNLSHNNLTGTIPTTFSNLKQIESLDLSYNFLSGRIPPQLVELNTLEVFNVAYNNLSGKIPDRVAQFSTFEENSYEGNPFLCGLPLLKSCNENGSPTVILEASPGNEEDDSLIDMASFYITFTVSYVIVILAIVGVLWVNPYWRRKWFYLVEMWMTSCYYFIVDNLIPTRIYRRYI